MTLEDVIINIEEMIYKYEKVNVGNFYYDNIRDLKIILNKLKEID